MWDCDVFAGVEVLVALCDGLASWLSREKPALLEGAIRAYSASLLDTTQAARAAAPDNSNQELAASLDKGNCQPQVASAMLCPRGCRIETMGLLHFNLHCVHVLATWLPQC